MGKSRKERKPYTPPYTHGELRVIWRKALIIPRDKTGTEWRMDELGNYIYFADYGNRDSISGWEVDHITRIADGGKNVISNLRPLQWEANVERG